VLSNAVRGVQDNSATRLCTVSIVHALPSVHLQDPIGGGVVCVGDQGVDVAVRRLEARRGCRRSAAQLLDELRKQPHRQELWKRPAGAVM